MLLCDDIKLIVFITYVNIQHIKFSFTKNLDYAE
jgi:hypothetical protein